MSNQKKNTYRKQVSFQVDVDLAKRIEFLRQFKHRRPDLLKKFESALLHVCSEIEGSLKLSPKDWENTRPCPSCGVGVMILKHSSKNVPFLGCSKFPSCRHSEAIKG